MNPKKELVLQDDLQSACVSFEQWRSTRKKRERIPDSLWAVAMTLSQTYSAFRIARTLRLNYKELRDRLHARQSQGTSPEFVELNVERMLSVSQCEVEVRSPGGFEIKIRTGCPLPAQLPELISCFLSETR
ncbi:MAG: hypothetical protein ACP5IL_15565 [Syntrophobacteraceae bacterium]